MQTPTGSGKGELESVNMAMRKMLDLYANVVLVKSIPGLQTKHNNVDIIVIISSGTQSGLVLLILKTLAFARNQRKNGTGDNR